MKHYSAFQLALLLCLPLFFSGCETLPPQATPAQVEDEAERVGYGADWKPEWTKLTEDFLGHSLKDPFSAVYRHGTPVHGWLIKQPREGGGLLVCGWLVTVEVNAKNSYGAYVGFRSHQFLIRDGRIVGYLEPGLGWQTFLP